MNNPHLQLSFENEYVFLQYLPQYPTTGKHLQLNTTLPCTITMGQDTFFFNDKNGTEKQSKSHLWYVYFDQKYNIPFKAFKTPETAYQFAVKKYKQYLQNELNRMKIIT